MSNKAVIISAPSGAGKTTIAKHLLKEIPELEFSVSACTRAKRADETEGKDYYFITAEEFRKKISNDEFVEWQEVYPGSYYGTLKSELQRIRDAGKIPIFDVDVVGGLNLKKYFGVDALAVFIQPPSPKELENRLRKRNTDGEESLKKRIAKAAYELSLAGQFDQIIINNVLEQTCSDSLRIVRDFLHYKNNHNSHNSHNRTH
jgi:guanylate kinase